MAGSQTWTWKGSGTAPTTLDLLVTTSMQPFIYGEISEEQPSGASLSASVTATDGFGGSYSYLVDSANNPYGTYQGQSTTRNLVPVPVQNGVATLTVSPTASATVSNTIPYESSGYPSTYYGDTNEEAYAEVSSWAQVDTRNVNIVALGHTPTYHKGYQLNSDGTVYTDPTTNEPVATAVLNTATVNQLEVDTWLGSYNYNNDIVNPLNPYQSIYTITYQPDVSPQQSNGDQYNFEEDLKGISEEGTVAPNMYSPDDLTDVPEITADYNTPTISYPQLPYPQENPDGTTWNYNDPQLAVGDAQSLDEVTLNYKFASDGATANYDLLVNFHLPYEKWTQIGNPQGDEDITNPYQSITTSPTQPQGGISATATLSPIDNLIAFAYTGASATLTSLAALNGENPAVAAFLAVTGYAVDKAAPPGSVSFADDVNNFQTAISTTAAANATGGNPALSLCNNPTWIAQWANASNYTQQAEQAQCTWQLEEEVPTRTYHYQGDNYGASGFIEEVKTDISQAEDPVYYHYYYAPSTTPPTPPVQPS